MHHPPQLQQPLPKPRHEAQPRALRAPPLLLPLPPRPRTLTGPSARRLRHLRRQRVRVSGLIRLVPLGSEHIHLLIAARILPLGVALAPRPPLLPPLLLAQPPHLLLLRLGRLGLLALVVRDARRPDARRPRRRVRLVAGGAAPAEHANRLVHARPARRARRVDAHEARQRAAARPRRRHAAARQAALARVLQRQPREGAAGVDVQRRGRDGQRRGGRYAVRSRGEGGGGVWEGWVVEAALGGAVPEVVVGGGNDDVDGFTLVAVFAAEDGGGVALRYGGSVRARRVPHRVHVWRRRPLRG